VLSRLLLTASGGPFFGKGREELDQVTPDEALAHPNWHMGAKITIDSSTFMNKGLELIEAHHLYGLPLQAIDVLVHKESVIHSLVEFIDGSQLAQLGQPDMRIPLANCLGWPERIPAGVPRLDLAAIGGLTFDRPDEEAFPCLGLARQAQERGCGSPVVLNAANEEAVAAFLERRIGFLDIAVIVGRSLAEYAAGQWTECPPDSEPETIEAILALDAKTRIRARQAIGKSARQGQSRLT
jgi:1-deoxy-D-xylulose-5-phosphate reductoisomerase